MLAGVVFHAMLAYSPLLHPFWPLADARRSTWIDAFAWSLHLFRMPLFFVVAGFFTALLTTRRGIAGMLRHRAAHVLAPLAIFLPITIAGIGALTSHALANVRHPSPALAWLRDYVAEHGAMPPSVSLSHLWFLFYLMLFAVLVWVASTLGSKTIRARLDTVRPGTIFVFGPLLLVPPLLGTNAPWPAPESPLPQPWALAFFGLFFAFGYASFRREALLDRLKPFAPLLLVGALAASAAFLWTLDDAQTLRPNASRQLAQAFLQAYAGAWMALWCLHAGKTWLNRESVVMRYLSDASYWVYLAHLPILFAVQYPLLDVEAHWSAKLAISTGATLALCFASYQLLVRDTPIGTLLSGRRGNARTSERRSPAG